MNVSLSSSRRPLPLPAQRKRREAPVQPEEKQPANADDKAAPEQSVKQQKEEEEEPVEKHEDQKKDQQEAKPEPAVSTKTPEETEFNVREVWLFS